MEDEKNESIEHCFGRFYAIGLRGHGFVYHFNDNYYTFSSAHPAPEEADLIVDNSPKGIMKKARNIVSRHSINSVFSDYYSWMQNGLYIAVLEGELKENGAEFGRFMVTDPLNLMDTYTGGEDGD